MEGFEGYNDDVFFVIDVLLQVAVLRLFAVVVLAAAAAAAAIDDDGFAQSKGFTRTEESMKPQLLPLKDDKLFVMDVLLFVENILVCYRFM